MKSAEQNELERHEEEIVAERRKIGEEMNLQVKEKIMGHLATIDVTDVPEHYGEFERNMCRAESDSADMDQLNTNQEQEQEAGHV